MMKMKHLALAAAASVAVACGQAPAPKGALETIMNRKSVRAYTEEPVTDAQVETILKAAMAAPSGMNVQPWCFVVVTDQSVKDALCKKEIVFFDEEENPVLLDPLFEYWVRKYYFNMPLE